MDQFKFEMKDYKDKIDNKANKYEVKDVVETLKNYVKIFHFDQLKTLVDTKVN